MSRAFVSILQLDLYSAVKHNVLSIPIFFGIVVYVILLTVDIVFNKAWVNKMRAQMMKRYMFAVYLAVFILGLIINRIL